MTNNPNRYCPRCSGTGPYRSDKAVRCMKCDVIAAEERKEFAKGYHAARAKAVSRLIKEHHPTFKRYLEEERAVLEGTGAEV